MVWHFWRLLYFIACAGLGELVLKLSLYSTNHLLVVEAVYTPLPLWHWVTWALRRWVLCCGVSDVAVSSQLGIMSVPFSDQRFDIIYALMDREFDQMHGVKSLPTAMGEKALAVAASSSNCFYLWCCYGWASVERYPYCL